MWDTEWMASKDKDDKTMSVIEPKLVEKHVE